MCFSRFSCRCCGGMQLFSVSRLLRPLSCQRESESFACWSNPALLEWQPCSTASTKATAAQL